MGGDERGRVVIVAGIGCRQGTTVAQLSLALDAALAAGGHDRACRARYLSVSAERQSDNYPRVGHTDIDRFHVRCYVSVGI